MLYTSAFSASPEAIQSFIQEARLPRLVTIAEDGTPAIGVHVFTNDNLRIEMHLVNGDPQLFDIRAGRPCAIEISEPLAQIPSTWVDPVDLTHGDQFYRHVVVRGRAELVTNTADVARHVSAILEKYQHHSPDAVSTDDARYGAYLSRITVLRLHGAESASKFKLGQRTAPAALDRIVTQLHHRGTPLDLQTVALVEIHRSHQRDGHPS